MSLGTGIFLSAIFLGLIALFIATRKGWDWKKIIRWDWKKIISRTAIVFAVIASLMLLTGIVVYFVSKIAEKPRVQKEFLGLTLDSTKEDIKFLKGAPSVEYKDYWNYNNSSFIIFKDNKIWFITESCPPLNPNPFIDIENIRCSDSYEKVIERLGKPSYIFQSKDGLVRGFEFEKYNVFFRLKNGRVFLIGIYNPTLGHPSDW